MRQTKNKLTQLYNLKTRALHSRWDWTRSCSLTANDKPFWVLNSPFEKMVDYKANPICKWWTHHEISIQKKCLDW